MSLNICFYEDKNYKHFFPLTKLRPVYVLRAGILPLFKRVNRYFPESNISLSCREQLAIGLAERYKDFPVNIIKRGDSDVLLLNGRIRDYGNLPQIIKEAKLSTIFKHNDETVAVILKKESIKELPPIAVIADYEKYIHDVAYHIATTDTTATLFNYCWEIVNDIEKEITADFNFLSSSLAQSVNINIHEGVFWVNREQVFLGNDVEILPGAVIDASRGPIYIGSNTRLESHTALYGPCYIGPNSLVLAGKISSSSIGHTCRVGGEVEKSVFHSYVNKYHAGFIGHSYVSPWVNFGAMTTNSDLKNNYSSIRIMLNGEEIDSGFNKVGSFIGDHTKFGIGTLLNTGINIGVCCNIFGGNLVIDKEIPSFSWGSTGNYVKYDIDKALDTAKTVAQRRNYEISERELLLLRLLVEQKMTDEGVINI